MALLGPVNTKNFVTPFGDDTEQGLLRKIATYLADGLGLFGVVAVGVGGTYSGRFWIYHALTDTVVSSVTYQDGSTFPAGSTVKAGDRIYGQITSIVIASGTGELYKAGP